MDGSLELAGAFRYALRTFGTRAGLWALIKEGAWLAAHIAVYPGGALREQLTPADGYRTDPLSPLRRSLVVTDPEANANAKARQRRLTFAPSAEDAVAGAELVLLLTEWQEFVDLDPTALATLVDAPRILDGRNALDPAAWRAAGWTYRALGRGKH